MPFDFTIIYSMSVCEESQYSLKYHSEIIIIKIICQFLRHCNISQSVQGCLGLFFQAMDCAGIDKHCL